jgi:hypothetical protein
MLAALLLVLQALSPDAPPPATPELAGWGAAKWGMTSAEVMDAVKGAKRGRPKLFALQGGPAYEVQHKTTVAGLKVVANFGFDGSGRLVEVILAPDKPNEASFQALKGALDRELGPTSVATPIAAVMEARWALPATSVLLTFHDAMRDPQVQALKKSLPHITPPSLLLIYKKRPATSPAPTPAP